MYLRTLGPSSNDITGLLFRKKFQIPLEHPPNDDIKYSDFQMIRSFDAIFLSSWDRKQKMLSWYCFMVELGEISIFLYLNIENGH